METPSSLPVKGFTPSPESARTFDMQYPNLEAEAGKILHESYRQKNMELAELEGDIVEKDTQVRHLDIDYLVHIAYRLMEEDSVGLQQMWAEEFTNKSIDIYGQPDYDVAASLIEGEASFGFEKSRQQVSEYLQRKYADVIDSMNLQAYEESLAPGDMADAFERGLKALKEIDSDWDEWSVDRNDKKDSLLVSNIDKQIVVGMKRRSATPAEAKGLFAHEVLRHAQTAVNGKKLDASLSKGLPGYLDFEEGMGVFYEYALTGVIKDELVDRYTDIARALGMGDRDNMMPRSALLEVAMNREKLRNTERPSGEKLSDSVLESRVYAHINRIYRGTPGSDEVVGVFTKDIAYLEGFLAAGNYIEDRLDSGDSIDEIMDYLSQGKFNPTIPSHVDYVAGLHSPKPSQELIVFNN